MTLNLDAFNDGSKKKSNTKYKAALGVSSVVGLFGIGSTLAANISLNGGGNVEFGQGVATTAACDEDGFTITPVTSFDNESGIFRVDHVQVSGLNLTPEGTGWDDDDLDFASQDDAKEAYPGQYYDGSDWKRTCDNVVIDFKAYTDDEEYLIYTDAAYGGSGPGSITTPVGWTQNHDIVNGVSEFDGASNPGFAVVFDSYNDDGSYYEYNFAVNGVDQNFWHGSPNYMYVGFNNEASMWTSNAQFQFRNEYDNDRPNAATISKITVQSMTEFPTSYYAPFWRDGDSSFDIGLGNPSSGWEAP
jgi:hypothetical protein